MGHVLGCNFDYLDLGSQRPLFNLFNPFLKGLSISSASKKIVLGVIAPAGGGESCIYS